MKERGQAGIGRFALRMRRGMAAVLLAAIVVPRAAWGAEEPATTPPEPAAGTSKLHGRVRAADGAPVVGATVLAYHLSTEQLLRSAETDAKGGFALDAVPYGYFDLAVLSGSGLYVADAVVNVPPAGRTTVSLDLIASAAEASRAFPGTDQQPIGIAAVNRKGTGPGFWGKPAGIAILAAGGAVALAALASGGDDGDSTTSPSSP
jgi:hypothetical protein